MKGPPRNQLLASMDTRPDRNPTEFRLWIRILGVAVGAIREWPPAFSENDQTYFLVVLFGSTRQPLTRPYYQPMDTNVTSSPWRSHTLANHRKWHAGGIRTAWLLVFQPFDSAKSAT